VNIVGYICIAVALVWLVIKLRVSYNSAGGTAGMTPVYDAAYYPPILIAFGLYWVLPTFKINWTIWVFVGIWLGLAALFAVAIRLMEELGDKEL
jgi:hypothetical protein